MKQLYKALAGLAKTFPEVPEEQAVVLIYEAKEGTYAGEKVKVKERRYKLVTANHYRKLKSIVSLQQLESYCKKYGVDKTVAEVSRVYNLQLEKHLNYIVNKYPKLKENDSFIRSIERYYSVPEIS